MTDPWEPFVEHAPASEVAGYFEQGGRAGTGGRAWYFHDGAETLTLDRGIRAAELQAETRRRLRRGGAVFGYVGFDSVGLFEPALARFPSGSPFPLGELAFVRRVRTARWSRGRRRTAPSGPQRPPLVDTLPRERFERSVRRLVERIRDGDAFQVVLAHRRAWPRPAELLERAGVLRATERYAFFYYLKFGDRELLGASPESVVQLRGARAFLDPIAGTVPSSSRGRRLPLRSDPKELAEHRMLVDLARNDLGRLARPGSVRLLWRERRERYARLEHLVSRVAGELPARRRGPWELLASTFPAGTVSGAPKIRAVELLREAEGTWRGPYGGAVGLVLPRGQASWALGIRSAFAAGRRLYTAAGAGIVHRSEPRREFLETLTKLSVLEGVLTAEGR